MLIIPDQRLLTSVLLSVSFGSDDATYPWDCLMGLQVGGTVRSVSACISDTRDFRHVLCKCTHAVILRNKEVDLLSGSLSEVDPQVSIKFHRARIS
ncbi:hypothetical protein IW262DRAFT_142155 [Armillaria fumosa]|nr:hypothetical protein IW262DRAFT_142155 [Armillaria fumosa]